MERVVVPALPAGHRYVFNPWDQQLVAYDPATGDVADTSGGRELYYYGFPTASTLYTVGDTVERGFEVVEVGEHEVTTVVAAAANEAIFPLATDGVQAFFVIYAYDEAGAEQGRRIVRLTTEGGLDTFASFSGPSELVDKGVLVGDILYYSVYDATTDQHTVYSIPAKDPGAAPAVVLEGLESGELYADEEVLLTSDGATVSGGEAEYACASLCWFYDELDILIRISTQEEELLLSVIRMEDGNVADAISGVVGFEVHESTLRVHTASGDVTFDLASDAA
ncbi:hypothetical protein [Demequina aestuarii]|uniref:hypothetical protein n=1 Tax=Demequina aestuarii TaxID=327095 RepID=UPI00128E2F2E|nr:hypothetical protein [Demequina aestuarii]